MYWTKVITNWPRTWWNTLCRPEIDPGHGRTYSANQKSTQAVAEHILPTGISPGTWQNTLCWPEIDLAEHTLSTKNWPNTWQNTLCWPKNWQITWQNTLFRLGIDPGHGGTYSAQPAIIPEHDRTHSANRELMQHMAEHTLSTKKLTNYMAEPPRPGGFPVSRVCSAVSLVVFWSQSVFCHVPGWFPFSRVCSATSQVDSRSAECVPPCPGSISSRCS